MVFGAWNFQATMIYGDPQQQHQQQRQQLQHHQQHPGGGEFQRGPLLPPPPPPQMMHQHQPSASSTNLTPPEYHHPSGPAPPPIPTPYDGMPETLFFAFWFCVLRLIIVTLPFGSFYFESRVRGNNFSLLGKSKFNFLSFWLEQNGFTRQQSIRIL